MNKLARLQRKRAHPISLTYIFQFANAIERALKLNFALSHLIWKQALRIQIFDTLAHSFKRRSRSERMKLRANLFTELN
jgi:hypothetical protein